MAPYWSDTFLCKTEQQTGVKSLPYGITATKMTKLHERKVQESWMKTTKTNARYLEAYLFPQLTIALHILNLLWIHNY